MNTREKIQMRELANKVRATFIDLQDVCCYLPRDERCEHPEREGQGASCCIQDCPLLEDE